MLYFGYGSNMPKTRIEQRLGPVERLGTAFLTGYTLRFHKRSKKDGSGKCDAFRTDNPDDRLWGVLDRLSDEQFVKLDGFEGPGYERIIAQATTGKGAVPVDAVVYVAKPQAIEPELSPFDWYKAWVLMGARELGLPIDYIETIEAVHAVPDPDPQRAAKSGFSPRVARHASE